jgi:5-dehydro-4-deoxyglucarate dehydratase
MMEPQELRSRLKGVMPFVPTPFREQDQEVDLSGLRSNIDFLLQHGVGVLGMCGFAGEFGALTFEEYSQVLHVTVAAAQGRALVVAGVGHATKTAIQYARQAQKLGADCVMLLPPFVADPPAEGMYHHLKAIAEAVDIGVMLHSMPGGAILEPDTIERLAELRNVVAYKDELHDIRIFHDIRARMGNRLVYVSANGEKLMRYYFLDGMGVLATAMGNFDPELIQDVYDCAMAGRHDELNGLLSSRVTPWYRLRERDRAYLIAVTKDTMNMLGLCGGVPRWPLWHITPSDHQALEQLLSQLGYRTTATTTADGGLAR